MDDGSRNVGVALAVILATSVATAACSRTPAAIPSPPDQALIHLRRAVAIDPENQIARENLARLEQFKPR